MITSIIAAGIAAYTFYVNRGLQKNLEDHKEQIERLKGYISEVVTSRKELRKLSREIEELSHKVELLESNINKLEDKQSFTNKKLNDTVETSNRILGEFTIIRAELDSVKTRLEKLEITLTGISSRTRIVDRLEREVDELKNMVESLKNANEKPLQKEERDRLLVEKWLNTPIEERSVNRIAREFGIHPSTAMRILRKHLGLNYKEATWDLWKNRKG